MLRNDGLLVVSPYQVLEFEVVVESLQVWREIICLWYIRRNLDLIIADVDVI